MNRCRQNQLVRLVVRDGDRCHWCKHRFDADHPVTFEHLIPRCYGGTNDDSNVVLACAGCNNRRNERTRCAACGCRIRRWTSARWVNRRDAFHATCAPAAAP